MMLMGISEGPPKIAFSENHDNLVKLGYKYQKKADQYVDNTGKAIA